MVIGIGGLAQGLAEGMNMGMQWHGLNQSLKMRQQHEDRMGKADERDSEIHELRKDQYASEKEIRDRRNNALAQIAEVTNKAFAGNGAPAGPSVAQDPNAPSFGAPPQQQTPSSSIQLAGPIPQGGLSMAAPSAPYAADNPAAGLATTPQAAQQAQPQQAIPPGKVLERGMVTGMYTPEMLTTIANIFAQNGLHEEGTKYLEQAYNAQKRGVTQAAMALMQNNPGSAIEVLKAGGVNLEDMPTKVSDDPNDHRWKINISGQGEQTINVKDWMQSTMDPEKFFEVEDRRRKEEREAGMGERKQANEERKTNAEIGYLKSRSSLAEANAGKADRYEPGGLKPSRSSESQLNTAYKRRDTAFDRISSVKNEEGKFEIDPMKRQELDSEANRYLTFLEDQRGEELDAREHHKFTDVMLSFPVGGTPEQIKRWERTHFLPRFGGKQSAPANEGLSEQQAAPERAAGQQSLAPTAQPTGPKPGSLAALQEKGRARQAAVSEMAAVQQALKSPNLSPEQKAALALKAQEIATRRDALK